MRRRRPSHARRKATVEPVFGQIRAARRFGQFSFRGLLKNRGEWLLVCATHHILKLWRALGGQRSAAAAAAACP
ncbi:MAG TPA: transposase [Kofleriaceae bacterium]|nr:transposase [Kofleriaceae bacterium]